MHRKIYLLFALGFIPGLLSIAVGILASESVDMIPVMISAVAIFSIVPGLLLAGWGLWLRHSSGTRDRLLTWAIVASAIPVVLGVLCWLVGILIVMRYPPHVN